MFLSGFADEAAKDLSGQIRAVRELGWKFIEVRRVDGQNVQDMDMESLDLMAAKLDKAGIQINALGSTVANWGRSVLDPFDETLAETDRCIAAMQRLGIRDVRIMSYAILKEHSLLEQAVDERIRRLRIVCERFQEAGLRPLHENCMNYGGMHWEKTLELVEAVPGLKLIFDTANPGVSNVFYGRVSSWEFYKNIKPHIAHIHIKDMVWDASLEKHRYVFPGEGDRDVRRILKDLLRSGYDDGIAIEPHLKPTEEDLAGKDPDEVRYTLYVEYGKRMQSLLEEIQAELKR